MFPKKNCLKKKKDFLAVFEKGKKIRGNFFYAKIFLNNKDFSRFGIIISKKIEKRAVNRNKIKRQTRAILREYILNNKKKIDCVIVFISIPKSFKSLEEDIKFSFEKLL